MLVCQDCDLRYDVIWHYDGDSPPNDFCPRCGGESLETEPGDETSEPPKHDAPDCA
jgi:rRNA maturation endonuclease Nob1